MVIFRKQQLMMFSLVLSSLKCLKIILSRKQN